MRIFYFIMAFLFSLTLFGQTSNNCSGAIVVCSSESVDFNPQGPGEIELNSTTTGCLEEGEHSSVWYYFEIAANAPANLGLQFLIIPENGNAQDYDFALYGPQAICDDLGAPIRCSYADNSPSTGLQQGVSETSENSFGDGYVAPITVNPGDGFFLLIDNYQSDGVGFNLNWSGDASQFLNCDATPPCLSSLEILGENQCQGAGAVNYVVDFEETGEPYEITWSSSTGNLDWLSETDILNPEITAPSDFAGNATFTLEISYLNFTCVDDQSLNITVTPYPTFQGLKDENIFCSDELITLGPTNSQNPNSILTWELDGIFLSNDNLLETNTPGNYHLTANLNGCITEDSFKVDKTGIPIEELVLVDSTQICDDPENGILSINSVTGGSSPFTYDINSDSPLEGTRYNNLESGNYQVIVTDVDGCTASSSIDITTFERYNLEELKDTIIELGDILDINAESSIPKNVTTSETWVFNNIALDQDVSSVSFTPIENGLLSYSILDENGCAYSTSMLVNILVNEKIYIANAFSPNEDNNNDRFYIQGGATIATINYLSVYSRWGELVFEVEDALPNDPSSGWNGLVKGESPSNSDVFVYVAEIELINGDIVEKRGSITIQLCIVATYCLTLGKK